MIAGWFSWLFVRLAVGGALVGIVGGWWVAVLEYNEARIASAAVGMFLLALFVGHCVVCMVRDERTIWRS